MQRGYIAERCKAFKHIVIAELQVIDDPRGVKMPRDQAESAVQIVAKRGASLLVKLIGRQTEAELDARHHASCMSSA